MRFLLCRYTNARKAKIFTRLVVATDDERIFKCVEDFGGEAVMTPESCSNGTERCLHVLNQLGGASAYDIVVNVQGDEPFIEPEHIEKAVACIEVRACYYSLPSKISLPLSPSLPIFALRSEKTRRLSIDATK